MDFSNYEDDKRTRILRQYYPHIFHSIRKLWGTKECREYMLELVLDTRNDTRRGFMLEAMKAIFFLLSEHDAYFSRFIDNNDDVWLNAR